MDWQFIFCCIAVGVSAVYLLLLAVRGARSSTCGGGCGCARPNDAAKPPLIASEELTMRQRHRSE
ncbi:MAG TPA: hypothetical protein VFE62_25230 [Gemmataceae bacterium]|nr:hypothetical protein [Gemmataceae bacterium]